MPLHCQNNKKEKKKNQKKRNIKSRKIDKRKRKMLVSVKIVDDGLYFIFPLHFYFTLLFFSFHFSIFRTARVRVDWSRRHISHKLMAKSQD